MDSVSESRLITQHVGDETAGNRYLSCIVERLPDGTRY